MRSLLLALTLICLSLAHMMGNTLWECNCWDYYVNEALKKVPRTGAPSIAPTYKPFTRPHFLKPWVKP